MKPVSPLPSYDQDFLCGQTPAELIALMIENEDRVPRNVIDECARRRDAMADALAPWAKSAEEPDERPGYWWLRLHAIMILGLIPGEHAAAILLEYIRDLCEAADENLQGWFSGYWPALTRNKPAMLIEQLRVICLDRDIDWFMRANLLEAVIASAQREGATALEDALDWAACIAADEAEDWDMRLLTASDLLNFPRERHRPLLDDLAAQQSGFGVHFSKQDIAKDYARNTDKPDWHRHENPWQFYESKAIESRQQRWAQEDAAQYDGHDYFEDHDRYLQETYTRVTPKIGRNDPCPCGSGKKYKKCCGK